MSRELEFQHQKMVTLLRKPGQDIVNELTPADADLWHMASALMGEAGELFDAVKKVVIYRKPYDRANLVEELGDLEFYLEGVRQILGISRDTALAHNLHKLHQRYGTGNFSNEQAQERKDKSEGVES